MKQTYLLPELWEHVIKLKSMLMVSNYTSSSADMTVNDSDYDDIDWEY